FMDEMAHSIPIGIIKPYHPLEEFQVRIVDYCSAACLAVSKDLFVGLGGFDPLYHPGYYEDVDLCFKMRSAGKFTYYCPRSTVIHLANATSVDVWGWPQLRTIIENSRNKFLERWGDYLRSRTTLSADGDLRA